MKRILAVTLTSMTLASCAVGNYVGDIYTGDEYFYTASDGVNISCRKWDDPEKEKMTPGAVRGGNCKPLDSWERKSFDATP